MAQLTMTTDSFTVFPLFFTGSEIGKIFICRTCNDLVMMVLKDI